MSCSDKRIVQGIGKRHKPSQPRQVQCFGESSQRFICKHPGCARVFQFCEQHGGAEAARDGLKEHEYKDHAHQQPRRNRALHR